MAGCDWSNPGSPYPFRYDKIIEPNPEAEHPDYPAVLAVWGADEKDEGRRIADLVAYLKANGVIEDYNQVALLLRSVQTDHSGHYLDALAAHGIKAFAPRARAYFENEEVRLIVGCFAVLLGWYGDNRGELRGHGLQELAAYVDECLVAMVKAGVKGRHPLAQTLQRAGRGDRGLTEGETLNRHLADYLYEFLAHEPFAAHAGRREPRPQPGHLQPACRRLPALLPLQRHHLRQPRLPAAAFLQQLPALPAPGRDQRVRGPRSSLPVRLRPGDDHPPEQGAGIPGRDRGIAGRQYQLRQAGGSRCSARSTTGRASSRRAASPSSTGCACTTWHSPGPRSCWS